MEQSKVRPKPIFQSIYTVMLARSLRTCGLHSTFCVRASVNFIPLGRRAAAAASASASRLRWRARTNATVAGGHACISGTPAPCVLSDRACERKHLALVKCDLVRRCHKRSHSPDQCVFAGGRSGKLGTGALRPPVGWVEFTRARASGAFGCTPAPADTHQMTAIAAMTLNFSLCTCVCGLAGWWTSAIGMKHSTQRSPSVWASPSAVRRQADVSCARVLCDKYE